MLKKKLVQIRDDMNQFERLLLMRKIVSTYTIRIHHQYHQYRFNKFPGCQRK
jgi:hypothetical protein